MSIFRLQINSLGRSAGRRATAAAADRTGTRVVAHAEIMLPAKVRDAAVDWARDRSRLWHAAEQAERRRTARVAREFQVALPAELSASQRLGLARTFSQELADRYGVAVDLAIHEPRPGGDPRNFHAHLLATTREVTPVGLGAKVDLDVHATNRVGRGLLRSTQEFAEIRARWQSLTNETLREAGIAARVEEIRRDAARTWLRRRHPNDRYEDGHSKAQVPDRANDDDHLP